MSALIGALRVTLGIDTAALEQGLNRAQSRMSGVGAAMQSAGRMIAGALAGGAVLQGLATLRDMTQAAVDSAGAIGEQAQALGVTTDALQEYRYAATQVGLSTEQMDTALAQLTRRTGEAASGHGATAQAFERLGISLRDASGNVKTAAQLIPEIAEAMRNIPSDAERAAVAVALFGRSGQQLAPLLSGGAAGVNELTQAAHRLGVVLNSDAIANADEVADQIAAINYQIEAQQNAKLLENADTLLKYEQAVGDLKLGLMDATVALVEWGDTFATNFAEQDRAEFRGWRNLQKILGDIAEAIEAAAKEVVKFVAGIGPALMRMSDTATAAVRNMVAAIGNWIGNRLNAIWDGVKAKIDWISDAFFGLYDAVVGHSYIPDMVDGIGANMARLQALMVEPAQRATASTGEAFRTLASDVSGLLDRLFPVQAQIRSVLDDMATLERALAAGQIDQRTFDEAHRLLSAERGDLMREGEQPIQLITIDEAAFRATVQQVVGIAQTDLARPIEDITSTVSTCFADMMQSVTESVQGIVRQIKSGDFLGALNSVMGTLQQAGVFGGGAQQGTAGGNMAGLFSTISSLFAGRANGGPVMANTPYMVGERRAELFVPSTAGRIEPNPGAAGRAGTVIHNHYTLPSDEFWSRVDGRAATAVSDATPGLIRAGAQAGVDRMARLRDRTLG